MKNEKVNNIGTEGVRAISEALNDNCSLTSLNLGCEDKDNGCTEKL